MNLPVQQKTVSCFKSDKNIIFKFLRTKTRRRKARRIIAFLPGIEKCNVKILHHKKSKKKRKHEKQI